MGQWAQSSWPTEEELATEAAKEWELQEEGRAERERARSIRKAESKEWWDAYRHQQDAKGQGRKGQGKSASPFDQDEGDHFGGDQGAGARQAQRAMGKGRGASSAASSSSAMQMQPRQQSRQRAMSPARQQWDEPEYPKAPWDRRGSSWQAQPWRGSWHGR